MKLSAKTFVCIVLLLTLILTGCTANTETLPTADIPQQTAPQESAAPQTEPIEKITPLTDAPTLSTDVNSLKVKTIFGIDYYDLDGLLYATELGEPVLGEKVVRALYTAADISSVRKTITHVGDALYYISNCGIFKSSEDACVLLATLLTDDYETVGFIQFNFTDENYYLIYLEHDETFYIFDPYMRFSIWDLQQEKALLCGTDLDELAENLSASIPYYESALAGIYISEQLYFRDDILMFWYGNTSFPVKLGLPKLSREQYAALNTEMDFDKTAYTITTLADVSKVTYGIPYIDNYSPLQRQKQNIEAANWIHRILKNDYEEMGYIYVDSANDYHIFLYILKDGMYYLIDPREYVMMNGGGAWLATYTSYLIGCAEDFQVIADSIIEILKLYPESAETVHFIRSNGDFIFKVSGKKLVYPHDTEVTAYYGKDFAYADPNYRWK